MDSTNEKIKHFHQNNLKENNKLKKLVIYLRSNLISFKISNFPITVKAVSIKFI